MGSVCVWKSWNIEHRVHSHTDTHDVSSPSAPPAPPAPTRAPPERWELAGQATKAAEHGEQRGDGVAAVDPGDPTRGGGAANRLNTRHNSQSKCGARRNACGSAAQAARATVQSIGAAGLGVLQTTVQLGAGGARTAPPLRTATEAVGREGLPPQAPATTPPPTAHPRRHSAHSSHMSLAQPQRQMWVRMMTGRSAGRRRISPGTRCDSVCAPTLDAPIATTACDDERSVSASWLERTDRGRATLSSEIRGAASGGYARRSGGISLDNPHPVPTNAAPPKQRCGRTLGHRSASTSAARSPRHRSRHASVSACRSPRSPSATATGSAGPAGSFRPPAARQSAARPASPTPVTNAAVEGSRSSGAGAPRALRARSVPATARIDRAVPARWPRAALAALLALPQRVGAVPGGAGSRLEDGATLSSSVTADAGEAARAAQPAPGGLAAAPPTATRAGGLSRTGYAVVFAPISSSLGPREIGRAKVSRARACMNSSLGPAGAELPPVIDGQQRRTGRAPPPRRGPTGR